MIPLLAIAFCLMNAVYGTVSAPYDQYCLPNNIEMTPEHYCGASAGCQPDPPGNSIFHLSIDSFLKSSELNVNFFDKKFYHRS